MLNAVAHRVGSQPATTTRQPRDLASAKQKLAGAVNEWRVNQKAARAKAGDHVAWTDLFGEHVPALVKPIVQRRLSGTPGIELDDVVSQIVLHTLSKFELFDTDKGSFSNWARRVATSFCVTTIRRHRVPHASLEGGGHDGGDDDFGGNAREKVSVGNAEAPLRDIEMHELAGAILRAVAQVPDGNRRPMVWLLEGLTPAAIGERMGIKPSAVSARASRARDLALRLLDETYFRLE